MFCRSTSIEHLDRSGFRDRGSFGGRSSIAIDQFSPARGSVEGRLAVNQPRSSANFLKRGPSEARARPDQGPIVSRSCQFRSTNAGPTAILRSAVRFFDSFFPTLIERRDGPGFRDRGRFGGRLVVHRPRSAAGSARPTTRLRLIEGRSRPIASRSIDPDLLIRAVRFLDLGSINFDRTPQSIGLSRSRLVRRSIQHHDRPVFSRSTLGRRSVGRRSIQSIEPRSATSGKSSPSLSRSRRCRKLEDRLIDSRLPIRYRFRSGRADFGSLEGRPVAPEPPVRNPFR